MFNDVNTVAPVWYSRNIIGHSRECNERGWRVASCMIVRKATNVSCEGGRSTRERWQELHSRDNWSMVWRREGEECEESKTAVALKLYVASSWSFWNGRHRFRRVECVETRENVRFRAVFHNVTRRKPAGLLFVGFCLESTVYAAAVHNGANL